MFLVSAAIFFLLLLLSLFTTCLLYHIYSKGTQNKLIRSACSLILVMYFVILAGIFWHKGEVCQNDFFTDFQAIFLLFAYTSLHAHFAFMMFNNYYVALQWHWRILEDSFSRQSILTVLAFILPLIPTFSNIYIYFTEPNYIQIIPGAFYSYLRKPDPCLWYIIFTVPGSIFALLLLFKTWGRNEHTRLFGSYTQFDLPYLMRLTFSSFFYMCLSFGSFIPLLLFNNNDTTASDYDTLRIKMKNQDNALLSPWLNINLCHSIPGSEEEEFFKSTMCPNVLTYFPLLCAVCLFLMYGYTSTARKAYKQMLFTENIDNKKLKKRRKKRNSALPSQDDINNARERVSGEDPEMQERRSISFSPTIPDLSHFDEGCSSSIFNNTVNNIKNVSNFSNQTMGSGIGGGGRLPSF